ncbi:hypothetical protein U27_01349 [Candidatus Vecturithrix granuli]|uniref:Porin domain-containing protein n=1 Tax=Vecturithrix granuli TaxID=1499967 RepID=A0A081CA44_VECG1|nr:hypothetical protein U27_01349 [Candidatus Vecturithrix granuli]
MKVLRYAMIALCAMLLLAQGVWAEMTTTMSISGDVETNTTAEFLSEEGTDGDTDTSNMTNDGRVKVTFKGRTEGENGWYGAAVAQPLVSTDGATNVDDAYVEFGTSTFAIRVGRYEGEGGFSKGEDVYIAAAPGAPGRYEANYARGRFGTGYGHVGFHFSPSDTLKLYVDTTIGHTTQDDVAVNAFGVRPVVKFSNDTFTVKVTGDMMKFVPQDSDSDYDQTKWGFGVDASTKVGGVTIGAAVARGTVSGTDVDNVDWDDEYTLSTFGYATIPVMENDAIGAAIGYTMLSYDKSDDEAKNLEGYLVYIHQLPVEGLKIKFAGSFSTAAIEPEVGSDADNTAFGFRMRLNYDF